MRSSTYNYQQPGRVSACERRGGLRTLATPSQDPSCKASGRRAARELRARASPPSAQWRRPGGAVLPAPTGCPQPCSPTLASWCFWEVGAALPPTGSLPEFGREGARRLMLLGSPWGLLCGPVRWAGDAALCALFSTLSSGLTWSAPAKPPGPCVPVPGTSKKIQEDPRPTETPAASSKPQIPQTRGCTFWSSPLNSEPVGGCSGFVPCSRVWGEVCRGAGSRCP